MFVLDTGKSSAITNNVAPWELKQKIPESAQVLSLDPLVFTIPDFLSVEECQSYMDHVKALSSSNREMTRSNPPEVFIDAKKLWPLPYLSFGAGIPPLFRVFDGQIPVESALMSILRPIVVALCLSAILTSTAVPLIRKFSDSSARTSHAIALNLEEDMYFVRSLVRRLADATGHPWHAWEAPVVTRYDPGAIFARHGDASLNKGSEWSETGGQRVVTAICYLNTVVEGGETYFDRLNLAVKPKQGSVLVFFPADVETLEADDRTTHESLPPAEGKWIVQMFGRIGPRVPPPLGLPDSFGSLDLRSS